jgi:hypothetical protein
MKSGRRIAKVIPTASHIFLLFDELCDRGAFLPPNATLSIYISNKHLKLKKMNKTAKREHLEYDD